MKELLEKLKKLNYSDELIAYVESNIIDNDVFEIPEFDYENLDQVSTDSTEFILKESTEPQSHLYVVSNA